MIDIRPALALSRVTDPDRRKRVMLMASAIEPPDRLPEAGAVAVGLLIAAAILLAAIV